ncbi:MAG: hypothetical protein LBP60_02065 [Spirochaetaceae bacterium]|jgi:DNA-directed RNA polymerase specialized sigma24 family protein|nr:hypothetical protein [Spirochaetaceae bacterium]
MPEKPQYLNKLLQDYRQGHISRKELEGSIFNHIRKDPRRLSISWWTEEAYDDFISWFYPRMSRAVDRYKECGSNFDAYITTMIRLSAKEYGIRKKEHRIIEKTWWDAKAEEMAVYEPEEPEYLEEEPKLHRVSNPRQVLMLLLKAYHYLSESHVARLAPAVGLTKEELSSIIDRLRRLRLQRDEAVRNLKERIHAQFYRCLAFEKRMIHAPPYSIHRLKMKKCLETARKRLLSMRKRLASMRTEASNEQIAQVLGVKKGTVDSNLHAVKQRNQTENQ